MWSILLRISLALWLVQSSTSLETAIPAKRYTINLDQSPQTRWTEAVRDHTRELTLLVRQLMEALPSSLVEMVHDVGIDPEKVLPNPYGSEIVGIAKAANLSGEDVLLTNVFYELTAYGHKQSKACTSIISQADNGTIYHARNLDYNLFVDLLRNITVVVDFQDNGRTVYTGTTFVGMVGLFTGQKPNKFTISLNERDQGQWWMNALEAILAGSHGVATFLVRDTLMDPEMDFSAAVEQLADRPLIAPCYIIVGGVSQGEGAVITRGRSVADDVWWLGSNGSWFLVETNYDHWEPPPSADDRRDPAIKAMKAMGQRNISLSNLFAVLSTPPVLNEGTTQTVIMSAAIPDLYHTWIRYPFKTRQ